MRLTVRRSLVINPDLAALVELQLAQALAADEAALRSRIMAAHVQLHRRERPDAPTDSSDRHFFSTRAEHLDFDAGFGALP